MTQDIYLKPQTNVMDEVVVSVGRYEQKLSDITVSMAVVKPSDLARQDPKDIRGTLSTLPGIDITDRQPSIRGGSGWTYGVGSRSLILVDGMSVLTPGVGEINWNTIPTENIDQVEIIKGASSVLYGSSALNGVINIRTARPGLDPQTHVNAYIGIHGNPQEKTDAQGNSNIWWNRDFWKSGKYPVEPFLRKNVFSGIRNPMYTGVDLSHTRRLGNWDLAGGLNMFSDEGYRSGDYTKRFRLGGNFTYHDPRINELNYGLNFNFLSNDYGGFFMWRSPVEIYNQSPLANMGRQGNTFYIDPFINYTNPRNNTSHKIKGRFYYKSDNIISNPTDKSLLQIADNMGISTNGINGVVDMIKNPGNNLIPCFLPHLPGLLKGDVNGVVNEIFSIGKSIFPKAQPADYVDLISWIMGHTPIPTNTSEIIPWLLNSDNQANSNSTKPDHTATYYLDYQFSKRFERGARLTAGATYEHLRAQSNVAGTHQSDNAGLYIQYDDKYFDRLNLSVGVRLEYYRVDEHYKEAQTKIFGIEMPFKPVFRGGLNYKLAEYSYLRASFGQGYRYPSVTEKYIVKNIGGVSAYPNSSLKPEKGFNTELGFKQGYQLGPFKGYLDIAGFYTEYKDMIEFNIGLFNNDTYEYIDNMRSMIMLLRQGQMPGIGAQFKNVDKARIYGVDLSVNGICDIASDIKLTYNIGYVYIEPEDVNYKNHNKEENANTDLLAMKTKSNNSKYLKYRQKHSVKGVFDLQWKRLNIGANMAWRSKTLAVDYFLVDEREKNKNDLMDYVRYIIFGDLNSYWKQNNKSHFTMDLRVGVQITKNIRFQGIINNLLNTEYSVRPMDVSAPRSFVIQMNANF